MEKEKLISELLLTSEGKEKLKAAMYLDTDSNFENFYGPIFDDILSRAEQKYTSENYKLFVKNLISLCQ